MKTRIISKPKEFEPITMEITMEDVSYHEQTQPSRAGDYGQR